MKLDRLLLALGSNPMYSISIRDNVVELRARAPSMHEAASVEGEAEEERQVVVVLQVSDNGDLVPAEAFVEGPSGRTPIPLDEIRWWLEVLDSAT
ncbi:MAG: hypothetical protein ACP5HK_05935 [Acidilobus sp.]